MSEYIVEGAVPNHTVLVEDEREVIWQMTHLPVREEVVRCRDCKHFTPNDEFWIEPPSFPVPLLVATCDSCDFWARTKCKVEPDGFCAWGEPREESE